jgi:hypothetical protein
MRISKSQYLFIITAVLAVYYLAVGIYMNHLGYYNQESIFYIEKTKIIFEGLGNRIKVMGLTSPLLPFYCSIIFSSISTFLAPVIASALGTAALFYILASTLRTRIPNDDFYFYLFVALFFLHPGLLYVATSGKAIYLVLISFFLFFFNLLKFYRSNTTFHVSLSSIALVTLIFCDYKFVWLCLFFIPLVLAITLQSLNLGEKESIFRLFLSFNSPSLRRKLVSKTFAIYIIMFILPIASIICYKLLNLTHASDLNYFIESPYATWNVLVDKLNYDITTAATNYQLPELSVLVSVRVIYFCPLILVAIYLFRESTYQALTILSPFAFIEFLHIKYDKLYITYEYYLIFLVLSLLCLIFKALVVKNQKVFKIIVSVAVLAQLYTGYAFLKGSFIHDEKAFITTLTSGEHNMDQAEIMDMAGYINSLPKNAHVLMDDAVAYPVAAFTNDIRKLTLPYQDLFLSAIETPYRYDDYILIATAKNPFTGYTQLNNKYIPAIRIVNSGINYRRVHESDNWILYKIISMQ